MKDIRIYPRIPGVKPMIFHDVENVRLEKDGQNWVLEFDHIDYVHKDEAVKAHSAFSSESAMAYTFLYEKITPRPFTFKSKKGEK